MRARKSAYNLIPWRPVAPGIHFTEKSSSNCIRKLRPVLDGITSRLPKTILMGTVMIFHLSIAAQNPERAARAIAEIWSGEATEFPPYEGAWIALAGDDRNSLIEVYPLGTELVPADGMDDAQGVINIAPSRSTATHAAIATHLTESKVRDIAARHGWTCKTLSRGGMFHVIEFWIEDAVMIEVLTETFQQEYLNSMTLNGWKSFLSGAAAA